MGYLSHRVDRQQIKPGDHIYTWRHAFTYSHHGIYVGENKVVHFTSSETANSSSGWNMSSSFPSSCSNSIPKSAANSGSGWKLSSGFPSSCSNSIPKSAANSGSGWSLSSSFPSSCSNSIPKSAANSGSGWKLSSGFPSSCSNSIPKSAANSGSEWNLSSGFPSSCSNSIDGGHSLPKSAANSGSGWNLSSGFPSSCLNSADCDFGSDLSTYECGFQQSESGVMISCLNCFIGTGSLYLCQYGASLCAYVTKIRGGTCTMAASDPPEDVMYRAFYLLHHGFGDYHVVKNNCEDFALYCKTGLLVSSKATTGSSGQVNSMVNVPWKIILAVPKLLSIRSWKTVLAVPTLVGSSSIGAVPAGFTGIVTVGKYWWNRYNTDIGVRSDVVKVKVEHVTLFRDSKYTGIEA